MRLEHLKRQPDSIRPEDGRRDRRSGGLRARLVLLSLLAAVALSSAAPCGAMEVENREYKIKAAFLYQFANFVRWPADAFGGRDDPFVIGVLGANSARDPQHAEFRAALGTIAASKRVQGRPIVVRHFANLDEYTPCHTLFVAGDVSAKPLNLVIVRLRDEPVLLVGETAGFVDAGGVIDFTIVDNHLRFEINLDAADRKDLKVISKLTNIAVRIIKDGEEINNHHGQ